MIMNVFFENKRKTKCFFNCLFLDVYVMVDNHATLEY